MRNSTDESNELCSSTINYQEEEEESVENINFESASNEQYLEKKTLKDKIGEWYFKNRPSRECFEELLQILFDENIDIPLSANSFIKKREQLTIKNVIPGLYCHFGIKKQILRILSGIYNCNKISIDINIDGLPLFKSSRTQLWPILVKIVNFPNISVFAIGVYLGKSKPSSIDCFLSELLTELKELTENGIVIENKIIGFEVRAVICDAPAKAFVCGIVGHTSSHGCTKCTQVGKKLGNVLCYSPMSADFISDADFSSRKYLNHHQKEFCCKQSPFEKFGLLMVTQVPLDPMHLIDLGVMKKILVRMNSRIKQILK
ncbi:hypothetical protein CVS40_8792 [Lucilia cuprina]|nr:hypothetical protein CVS40_8792 [Lucilia cuprina]